MAWQFFEKASRASFRFVTMSVWSSRDIDLLSKNIGRQKSFWLLIIRFRKRFVNSLFLLIPLGVKPVASARTRAVIRSGNRDAKDAAMAPPKELPTMTAFGMPNVSMNDRKKPT